MQRDKGLANMTTAITLRYTHVSNQHVVRVKLTQCYMSNIPQLKKPNTLTLPFAATEINLALHLVK